MRIGKSFPGEYRLAVKMPTASSAILYESDEFVRLRRIERRKKPCNLSGESTSTVNGYLLASRHNSLRLVNGVVRSSLSWQISTVKSKRLVRPRYYSAREPPSVRRWAFHFRQVNDWSAP